MAGQRRRFGRRERDARSASMQPERDGARRPERGEPARPERGEPARPERGEPARPERGEPARLDRAGPARPTSRRGVRVARRAARRRRDPETARQEILDAAERVFAGFHPDRVGLKEVAREAGVSHALITHYFGTYGGLVEAALERRIRALRARMMARMLEAGALARPAELLGMLFDALDDPVHLRLMKWMVANERQTSAHALALQERGVQLIARQVAEALVPKPAESMIVTIELALVTAVSAAFGWSMSKVPLAASVGRSPTPALQAGIRATLAGMVQTYLRATIGPMIPGGLELGEEPQPLEPIGPRDDE